MSSSKKVRHYKYKNIAGALAVLLLAVLALSTSCNSHKNESGKELTLQSETDNSSEVSSESNIRLTKSYKYENLKNSEQLGKGNLVIVNKDHPFSGTVSETDGVYSYLFDKDGNQIMYASSSELSAPKEVFASFNKLGEDFYKKTGNDSVMISGAYSGSTESTDSSSEDVGSKAKSEENKTDLTNENVSGLGIDLRLYDAANGTYPEFTGEGDYSWITENCGKYGFILRYPADKSDKTGENGNPAHFRYVGVPFAEIMTQNSLTLEEFMDFVKQYTFENPMEFESEDEKNYLIYYVAAEKGDTTNVPIPQKSDGSEYTYTLSGNNIDGYIICINSDEDTEEEPVSDNSEISQKSEAE